MVSLTNPFRNFKLELTIIHHAGGEQ